MRHDAVAALPDLLHGSDDGPELLTQLAGATADAAASSELAAVRYAAGLVAFRAGDNARCRELSASALAVATAVGSPAEQARAHIGLSRADFRDGDYAAGLEHAEAAAALAASAGTRDLAVTALHPAEQIELDSHLHKGRSADAAAFEQGYARGRELPLAEARALAGQV